MRIAAPVSKPATARSAVCAAGIRTAAENRQGVGTPRHAVVEYFCLCGAAAGFERGLRSPARIGQPARDAQANARARAIQRASVQLSKPRGQPQSVHAGIAGQNQHAGGAGGPRSGKKGRRSPAWAVRLLCR